MSRPVSLEAWTDTDEAVFRSTTEPAERQRLRARRQYLRRREGLSPPRTKGWTLEDELAYREDGAPTGPRTVRRNRHVPPPGELETRLDPILADPGRARPRYLEALAARNYREAAALAVWLADATYPRPRYRRRDPSAPAPPAAPEPDPAPRPLPPPPAVPPAPRGTLGRLAYGPLPDPPDLPDFIVAVREVLKTTLPPSTSRILRKRLREALAARRRAGIAGPAQRRLPPPFGEQWSPADEERWAAFYAGPPPTDPASKSEFNHLNYRRRAARKKIDSLSRPASGKRLTPPHPIP